MRCDNESLTKEESDPKCASKEEIDIYISNMEIEIIVVNKQLDTNKKDG